MEYEGDINTLTHWAVCRSIDKNDPEILLNQIIQFDEFQNKLFKQKELPKIEYHDLYICSNKRGWIKNFINMDQFSSGMVNKLLLLGMDLYYLRVLDGNTTRSLATSRINEDNIRNISFIYNKDFLSFDIDNIIFWNAVILNWEWYNHKVENENIWLNLLHKAEPKIFQCDYFFRLWRHADDLQAYKIIKYLKQNYQIIEWDSDLMSDIIGNDFDFVEKYPELSNNKIIKNEKMIR